MDTLIHKLIILTLVSSTYSDRVKWVPNSSFNLPKNFKDGKLPCSKKDVVFPESIAGSVDLQSALDVSSLILPETGELLLEDVVIELGDKIAEENCTKGNSYYLDSAASLWTQAGVWTSSRFNEATPDSERLPCYDDIAEFPADAKYTVLLPEQEQVIQGIKINTTLYLQSKDFTSKVQHQSDEMQQFVLNTALYTGLIIKKPNCHMRFGCPCQQKQVTIDCTAKFCPKPTCATPVKAQGFCCSFCGGHLMFDIDEGFDMKTFKELVEKTVDGYGGNLVYHIGIVLEGSDYKIRLVIVDKGEYEGNSATAVNYINYNLENNWFKGEKLFLVSGSPLSKQGMGWKIFISMFFGVVSVMGLIYLYYYKLPQVRIPAVGGGTSSVLSRFQYRSNSVVSLFRKDSTISSELPSGTAFRNPLYDSKRGRVQVEQSVDEE